MNEVATFEKVSFEQWMTDCEGIIEKEAAIEAYDKIQLPCRSTAGSAGYDFFLPVNIGLKPGESVKLPTGIKVRIDPGWVLMAFPRSSLGYKYNLHLANTVGIIDADYYNNINNEGHIFQKLVNDGEKIVALRAQEKFCQGIFVPFGITTDDHSTGTRVGGFGSTGA